MARPYPPPCPVFNPNTTHENKAQLTEGQQHQEWVQASREQQQQFYSLLGDRKWDLIPRTDKATLTRKVAFGFYGPPTQEYDDSCENEVGSRSEEFFGYTKEQMKIVEETCKKIKELTQLRGSKEDIRFACIFICGRTKTDKNVDSGRFIVPVFKTLKREKNGVEEEYFIDTICRVYDGWDDYLKSNQLPPCDYCYPRSGTYTCTEYDEADARAQNKEFYDLCNGDESDGSNEYDSDDFQRQTQVDIEYGMSPSSKVSAKALSAMDRAATWVTWGATAVKVAKIFTFPITDAIAAAASIGGLTSGAYIVGRSGLSLHDRKTHGQSIGLLNADARNCWLTVVGGALGFAQVRMMSKLAKAAELGQMSGVASKAGRLAFLVVNVGVISVSGVGLISSFAGLLEKREKNQLTSLDILQFSASCLFFTHSLMNCKTAESVIREVQNDIIDGHRGVLGGTGTQNLLYKFKNNQRKNVEINGESVGNTQTVKSINVIQSKAEFFLSLVEGTAGAARFISSDEFRPVREMLYNNLKPWITKVISKLCEYFHVQNLEDIEIRGVKVFRRLKQLDIEKFAAFLKRVYTIYGPEIIEIFKVIVELKEIPIENHKDFCVCLVNVCLFVCMKVKEYQSHEGCFDFFSKPGMDQSEQRVKYFRDNVYSAFKGEPSKVQASLVDFEEIIQHQNATDCSGNLLDDLQNKLEISATQAMSESHHLHNHMNNVTHQGQGSKSNINMYSCFTFKDFESHCFESNGNLKEQYCIQIASELVGVPLTDDWGNTETKVSYEGNSTFVYFSHVGTSASGVQIEKIGEGNHCYGVVTILL